jgi:hypothetical protein
MSLPASRVGDQDQEKVRGQQESRKHEEDRKGGRLTDEHPKPHLPIHERRADGRPLESLARGRLH